VASRFFVAFAFSLAAIGCYDPDRVTAPDEVLLLTATPDSIPANGFSTSRITARVTTTTARSLSITFTSSAGTISPSTGQKPDAAGEASVFLISEATPKTVSVTAQVKEGDDVLASRSVTVIFQQASADSLVRLTAASSQIDADGASSVILRAEVNPASPTRAVSFKTTAGSFELDDPKAVAKDNVATSADGVAQAQLFAPLTAGTALVTVTTVGANGAPGFSASQTITFNPALPDFAALTATPLSISRMSGAPISLVAKLSRSIGEVTRGTRVDFTAANDDSGQSFGRFENVNRSDDMETATADFVPGATAPIGLATITARVPNTNVSVQIKVDITN
jgi:hypothetical protein